MDKFALIQGCIWSAATWLFIMMSMYFGLLATGIFVPPATAILGASGAIVATLLPINTTGTIGSYEIGWTIGYSAVGMPASAAVSTGIVVHFFLLTYTSVIALIAHLGLMLKKQSKTVL